MLIFFKKYSLLFLLILFASTSNSYSVGLGVFIPFASGTGHDEIQSSSSKIKPWNSSYNAYGFGLVFDTKVAEDKLVNYRLNIGFTYQSNTFDGDYQSIYQTVSSGMVPPMVEPIMEPTGFGYDLYKFSLDNSFGFGFVRTSYIRLWAGPQVRLGFGFGDRLKNQLNSFTTIQYSLGLAPVIGANFNIGKIFSICADLGYRYSFNYGMADYETYSAYVGSSSYSDEIYRNEKEFFVNISAMFRIHDVFDNITKRK